MLTFSIQLHATDVRCYDMEKLINYLCYRICLKRDFDYGSFDKEIGDCLCRDKPYQYHVDEAKIVILSPLHTNLSPQND